jgi:hypothetical protein
MLEPYPSSKSVAVDITVIFHRSQLYKYERIAGIKPLGQFSQGKTLHEDGKHHDDVSHSQDGIAFRPWRKGQCQCNRDASAQTAPGKQADHA